MNPSLIEFPGDYYRSLAARGKQMHDLSQSFKLSYLIRSPRDVFVVPQHHSVPNFVTQERVEAPLVHLGSTSSFEEDILGCVVCIENADPGFDWVFTRGIAGMITRYGGANSHMAIRCSEYGIPAAIGCGDVLFQKVLSANRCEINAGTKEVKPL